MPVRGSKKYLRIFATKFLLCSFKFDEILGLAMTLQFHYDKMVNSKQHGFAVIYRAVLLK